MGSSLDSISQLVFELHQLLSQVRDQKDESIKTRRNWLEKILHLIEHRTSEFDDTEILQEIRDALRGGMGSFMDIHLFVGDTSSFTEQELNEEFERLVNEIFDSASSSRKGD